jgi:hypothetical protein
MSSSTPFASSSAVSIVPERRFVVRVTFGLMALIFAGALGLGAFIEDAISRRAIQAISACLLAAILVAWVHTIRNPARLEITPGSITLARGARPNLRRSATATIGW